MSGYTILGGTVPPYQVLQQQNAGLPPGSIPQWMTMQYPAGYVQPMLISVNDPLEVDPFDPSSMLLAHHDEREQRDLRRSHLIGRADDPMNAYATADDRAWAEMARGKYWLDDTIGAETYDIANIARSFNGIFFTKKDGKLYPRLVPVEHAEVIAKLAEKAVSRALQIHKDKPVFAHAQKSKTEDVYWKVKWHVDNLAKAKKEIGPQGLYRSSDDLRQWALAAFIEYNAASLNQEYMNERLSFFREVGDQLSIIAATLGRLATRVSDVVDRLPQTVDDVLDRGIASVVPWWLWVLGGIAAAGASAYFLMPFVVPALARTAAFTASARQSVDAIRGV